MTDDYTKQIEDENEKLRLRLSTCEEELDHWKPRWIENNTKGLYNITRVTYSTVYGSMLGYIITERDRAGNYIYSGNVTTENNKSTICKGTFEECKQKIETYWKNPKEYENKRIEELKMLNTKVEEPLNNNVKEKPVGKSLSDFMKSISKGYIP